AAAETLQMILGRGPGDPQDVALGFVDTSRQLVVDTLRSRCQRPGGARVGRLELGRVLLRYAVAEIFDCHVHTVIIVRLFGSRLLLEALCPLLLCGISVRSACRSVPRSASIAPAERCRAATRVASW